MRTILIKSELEAEVEGLGKIYQVYASFDQSLRLLMEFGIENPISVRDLAYARIKKRRNSSLCNGGSYTREGFLYRKKVNLCSQKLKISDTSTLSS